MCKYKEICPAYDKWEERCNDKPFEKGHINCIPFLLEAYHSEKGTPYEEITRVIYD